MVLTSKELKIPVAGLITFLVLFLILTRTALEKIVSQAGVIDDLIILLISGYVLFRLFETGFLWFQKFSFFAILLFFWMVWGVYQNELPSSNLLQILIYYKIIIMFLFFHLMPLRHKETCLKAAIYSIYLVAVLAVLFALFELFFRDIHSSVFVNRRSDRGINGMYLTSIWGHRVGFADFLILSLIVLVSYSKRVWWLSVRLAPISVLFGFLVMSSSRKEIVLGTVILFVSAFSKMDKFQKWFGYLLLLFTILAIGFGLWTSTQSASRSLLTEDYIRWQMVAAGSNALVDSNLLGTGVGTFGSQLSREYTEIYSSTGLFANRPVDSAPIFDIGYLSLIVELGFGFLLVVAMIGQHLMFKKIIKVSWFDVKTCLFMMLITFVILGLFTPIFTNWVGMIIAALYGIQTAPSSFGIKIHTKICPKDDRAKP